MHNFVAHFRKGGNFLKSYKAKWPRKQVAFIQDRTAFYNAYDDCVICFPVFRLVDSPRQAARQAWLLGKFRVWIIVAGRGSIVAAGENDLEFEVTEWKRLIWKNVKGKKSFLCTILYSGQFTGYGCYSQQNNVSRKDLKEKAGRLLCSPQVHFVFFLPGPVFL